MSHSLGILCSVLFGLAAGLAQTESAQTVAVQTSPPCRDVSMLDSQPLSAWPTSIQRQIHAALKPSILAFAKTSGAVDSEEHFDFEKVSLEALLVAKDGPAWALYVVRWGLPLFGVNAPVWIVEVDGDVARSLIDPATERPLREGPFHGWGMAVIARGEQRYPEMMFASKGFAPGGGAEAEADCVRKAGAFYRPEPCPADCFRNLNQR